MKKIALVGNPNVGKSTIFNALTKSKEHTGNWTGKTVKVASSIFKYKDETYKVYDLPGTYSLRSNSKEEEVARDFISFCDVDITIIVLDASLLERNLNLALQVLEVTNKAIVVLNLMDEAKKEVDIDIDKLKSYLNVDVIGISAKKKKDLSNLKDAIYHFEEKKGFHFTYPKEVMHLINSLDLKLDNFVKIRLLENDYEWIDKLLLKYHIKKEVYLNKKLELLEEGYDADTFTLMMYKYFSSLCFYIASKVVTIKNVKGRKIDKILTHKVYSFIIIFIFLLFILWITLSLSSYPTNILTHFFTYLESKLFMKEFLFSHFFKSVFHVVTFVVAVMTPPMAIFFPMFSYLEELGFLPRIAFNLDACFKKCKSCGKQSLTMMMGFGCNAVGVMGSRIIDSKKERLLSILTNVFIPCNGRFPTLISIFVMFFYFFHSNLLVAFLLSLTIIFCILITLLVTKILSLTILKKDHSSFLLELPKFRKPNLFLVLKTSFLDKTLKVLIKAVKASILAGIFIFIFSNVKINGDSLLLIFSNILDPFGKLLGVDGAVLLAFLLAFPANEIVIPTLLMIYLNQTSLEVLENDMIKEVFILHGWNIKMAFSFLILLLFHFPCATTLSVIYSEVKSIKWTLLSILIPLCVGILFAFTFHLLT